jgi:hypothetical protein
MSKRTIMTESRRGSAKGHPVEKKRSIAAAPRHAIAADERGWEAEPSPAQSEPRVSVLARKIRAATSQRGIRQAIRLGELLEEICGEDSDPCSVSAPSSISVRRLAEESGLRVGASTLGRARIVHRIVQRRPDLLARQNVRLSHLYVLGPLPQRLQDQLLELTERERWSVARLREEVVRLRGDDRTGAQQAKPRMPKPADVRKALDAAVRAIRAATARDAVQVLLHSDTRELLRCTRALCRHAEKFARRLGERTTEVGRKLARA